MPQYVRVVLNGGLGIGDIERWSCGINFGLAPTDPAPSPSALGTSAEAVRAYWASADTAPTLLRGYWSSSGSLLNVRCYYYVGTGQPASYVGQSTGARVAGQGSISQAPQVTAVFSLLTGQAGRSYRGRFYWPAQGSPMTSNLTATLPSQSSADAMSSALTSMGNLIPGGNAFAAVVSEARDLVTPVTSVSIDSVLDTQRSRRDNVPGTRYASPVAP